MAKIYFVTGSQDLYGEDVLKQVAINSKDIADYLNGKLGDVINIEWKSVVRNSQEIVEVCQEASRDKECIGIITWMHTFSPAKMWIKGLQFLSKPLLHLHTQANKKLPYDTIDMDFMNLNQSAHGDREYGFIVSRLNIPREVVVGYYKDTNVIKKIRRFAEVVGAIDFSKNLKVAMFGSNMRDVAVTDGDRVESQIKYGWEVNYYGIGDLVDIISGVTPDEIDEKMEIYKKEYEINTDNLNAIREQAKYEIALERFLDDGEFGAYTNTFEDLHNLKQLPGLATQRIMAQGIGFGAEGDYKTAALNAILFEMAKYREGATGFMEDYTYDFEEGLVLGAHMLEVSPTFAATKPKIEVHPLGIGDREPPARLVFDGKQGDAISVCMVDMGNRFRLIAAEIELIKQPKPMPNLPVARIMWEPKPDLETGLLSWIYAGGGHHTVISNALTIEDIELFAKLTETELIVINKDVDVNSLQRELELKNALAQFK